MKGCIYLDQVCCKIQVWWKHKGLQVYSVHMMSLSVQLMYNTQVLYVVVNCVVLQKKQNGDTEQGHRL